MNTTPTPDPETFSQPSAPNTMSYEFIQMLVDNYRNNHLVAIKDKLNLDDSHSIHFGLDTLKKFISDIETEAQKNNPDITEEDLGIRFYYAAYPTTANWSTMANTPVGTNYAERHTLVMIPTLKKPDENGDLLNYDFNPLESSEGEFLALPTQNQGLSGEIMSQNHGALNPPNQIKVELF
ncbi:hypothetical protein ODZ84_16885 [Chryseobacterium fluminis]|uniref:hypothetical protein n=1 Tax=Chryseobacterium fluminis TaxID=2983606 RepID=UPI0022517278|nr:hypothetical protein [Chryseobacterium sp. MMS21-Ot14]UZT96880.1 hypothetical protein ODZ84_16885 [Chryseobacterium sp. MMS21-Ot14]